MGIKIEGMEGVIREIRKLPPKIKRREVVKIMKRQIKPIQRAIKANTPIAERDATIRGVEVPRGNLKRSITIFTGKNKLHPAVYVGPAMGSKKKHDGFYGYFIQYGLGTSKGTPNDFIGEAALPLLGSVNKVMSKDLKRYIDNRAKTLNL